MQTVVKYRFAFLSLWSSSPHHGTWRLASLVVLPCCVLVMYLAQPSGGFPERDDPISGIQPQPILLQTKVNAGCWQSVVQRQCLFWTFGIHDASADRRKKECSCITPRCSSNASVFLAVTRRRDDRSCFAPCVINALWRSRNWSSLPDAADLTMLHEMVHFGINVCQVSIS